MGSKMTGFSSNIDSPFMHNKKYLKVSDNSFILRNKNKKLNKVKLFLCFCGNFFCFLVETLPKLDFIDHFSLL